MKILGCILVIGDVMIKWTYVILGSHELSTGRLGGAWDGADGRLSVNYWRIERVIKCATAHYV